MSDPSWEHEFCLYCDTQTDGALYCSESCRLRDFEKSSSSLHTTETSPDSPSSSYQWSNLSRSQTKFYLPPAYDFANAQPYSSSPPDSPIYERSVASSLSGPTLTPSSSHSSLCSLGSTSSSRSETPQISDKTKKHLRDYASSFEHARTQQRRRSNC